MTPEFEVERDWLAVMEATRKAQDVDARLGLSTALVSIAVRQHELTRA